ncbi:MAG: DNA alkylation repair protein [Hyphomicrobiales bacterium]|nr:DNA alkylation repair protein [Hyphomicrobiales bacterium]
MEPFKNNISPRLVGLIADQLSAHLDGFDRSGFMDGILSELEDLELKDRARLIAHRMHAVLPADPGKRNAILATMLHPMDDPESDQSDERGIRGWGMMPLGMVVGLYGVDDFDGSLALLRTMTPRWTSEFDVRYFLLADEDRALATMTGWLGDPDYRVRRLVSEGTRPRLPWGVQLPQLVADPSPTLPILTKLRDDPEEYVRRSVANHLNDIAKDHPDLVVQLASGWMKDATPGRLKLLRHACRTLIKQGHASALRVFGFGPAAIRLSSLQVEKRIVTLGDSLAFACELTSTSRERQELILDYVLHFRKANGTLSPKVFKWKVLALDPRQTITLQRTHAVRAVTTRRYYAGDQMVSLRINGQDFGEAAFELIVPEESQPSRIGK